MGAIVDEGELTIPAQVSYLMDEYKKLKFSRIPNGDGFSLVSKGQIGYNEIKYYSELTGLEFMAWEVDALLSLDSIFERAIN